MGNSIYQEIQNKYGPDGVDYIAFRYHERKSYKQVIEKIALIKKIATQQQQNKLDLIIKEKHKLQKDFEHALKTAQLSNSKSILKAEAHCKQKVQEFSGFNDEWNRLDNIYKEVNSKYEAEKASIEKQIREEVMRKLNKSKLKSIKEFDYRSDKTRRKIENQCIEKHPVKAILEEAQQIVQQIKWQNQQSKFEVIFDEQTFFMQAEAGRTKVRNGILPSGGLHCC